jgi:hypothetical protein
VSLTWVISITPGRATAQAVTAKDVLFVMSGPGS